MKYLTDQFQLCFCFCSGRLNSYILFLHWNTISILTDNLVVATYALSCLYIPVSNVVVESVFSHDTFVFRLWKSCDFECVEDRYQY